MVHVSSEELSALLDGELSPGSERRVRQHLGECESCSAEYAHGVRVDNELRLPPVLACDAVHELLSAAFDHQANEAEEAAVQRHLARCDRCPKSLGEWAALSASLRALPIASPSARVDAAVRGLVNRRTPRPAPRTAHVTGIAARGLIALTAVFAIVVAGLNTGPRSPTASLAPGTTDRVLVAAMQQVVFNPNNNTLYMLDVASAAVDARAPGTNDLKARIAVGGEPTALALNESANTILVLDATSKRVTEIDAGSNTVIGATTVAVTGTPTSISVDPNAGKIIVTTVDSPKSAERSQAGAVAVIDSATKQLETVREIDVAPRLVVPDPLGSRTALVSADAVTIVDSSYKVVETLPGGVSAAFSQLGDSIAVLSASGGDAQVTFAGPIAPETVKLQGAPRAMIALPDGGYLVLSEAGGRGRVSHIGRYGGVVGTVEIAVTGGDLIYDETTDRFTVASAGRLSTAEMPTGAATTSSGSPAQSASASPSATASPSASPSTSPEAAVAASASPAAASTAPSVRVFDQARLLSADLYTVPLPNGVQPQMAAEYGSRLWLLDQANGVSRFDTGTGDLIRIGNLRAAARIGFWVAGPSYVFGVDASNGEIHVVQVASGRIDAYATNVLSPVSAVAVGFDDRLWIGLRDAPYLFVFDAKTRRMDSIDLGGARISALTIDSQGRVLYSDDFRGTVGVLDPRTSRLTEVGFAKRGTTTALLSDQTSTLWLGTSTGEVYAVRGGAARLTVTLQRPVTALALDPVGRAWYLAPLPSGLSGYAYAPADGSAASRSIPGPAVSLSFNPLGRALLADPRGGIYMSTEGAR